MSERLSDEDHNAAVSIAKSVLSIDAATARAEKCTCMSCLMSAHKPARMIAAALVDAIAELRAAREVVEAAMAWRATTGHEASDHMLLNQRDARRALLDAIDALAGAK